MDNPLDTRWQTTRPVIEEWARIVRKYRGEPIPFSQALYLSTAGGGEGDCFGFSVAYIVETAKSGDGRAVLQNAFDIADQCMRGETANKESILRFQIQIGNYHQMQFGESLRADLFAKMGFQKRENIRHFDQAIQRFEKAANYITSQVPSYSLILTPNHAMAATIGSVCTYFDPNVGIASFPTPASFRKFLRDWLQVPIVNRAYRGRTGGKMDKHNRKYLTLHLRVEQYQYVTP